MLLNKQDRIQLRGLYDDPKFTVVLRFLDSAKVNLEKANTVGNTEFETLALTFSRQYKMDCIDEIKRLLQEEAAAVGVDDDN